MPLSTSPTADRTSLSGTRALVISGEQVGVHMTGPAIRSLNLARQLANRGCDVTLATPAGVPAGFPELAGVQLAAFGSPSPRGFRALARAHDVVFTQPQRVDVAWGLRSAGTPVIYDLYVPSFVERIAQLATQPMTSSLRARLLERDRLEYAAAIELGQAFICASEQQKDHWLGALGQAGRLDIGLLARDPRADMLVGVVPFGIPDVPPADLAPGEGALRGTLVPHDAIVLLWTGGMWNWFDPVTVLEGLAQARASEPRLHLVAMGMRHPDARWEEHEATRITRERARDLGMLDEGGGVVLREDWVPYSDRHRYLLDADVAVCSHLDSLETRLSFRTRFLDHLWSGLPTVTTAGGELTDRMVAAGAALDLPERDPVAWSASLTRLAQQPALRERMGAAARQLGEQYRWSLTSEPLARIVAGLTADSSTQSRAQTHVSAATWADTGSAPPRPRRADALRYARLLVQVRVQSKGLRSLYSAARGALSR